MPTDTGFRMLENRGKVDRWGLRRRGKKEGKAAAGGMTEEVGHYPVGASLGIHTYGKCSVMWGPISSLESEPGLPPQRETLKRTPGCGPNLKCQVQEAIKNTSLRTRKGSNIEPRVQWLSSKWVKTQDPQGCHKEFPGNFGVVIKMVEIMGFLFTCSSF